MATSGTYTFFSTLQSMDICQEAFERCGIDFSRVSGNQIDSARRSLQLMISSDWSNRGPNLWKVELQSSAITSGQSSITLNANVIEVLQAFIRDSSVTPSIDYVISQISRSDYSALPYKTQSGNRPTQFYFQRTSTPTVFLWPVQDNATKTFYYYSWRTAEDVGDLINQIDAPNRWIDAACAGLAARVAEKWAPEKYAVLKQVAVDSFNAAAAEDVESVPMRIVPNSLGGRWS